MQTVVVGPEEPLPLTCTRTGACCHGKRVRLNPWELAQLAGARGMAALEFRRRYTEAGGLALRFDGPPGFRGLPACSQLTGHGCEAYAGRPLSCRLFPLGRAIQSGQTRFVYSGPNFPCLDGCPEVAAGPRLRLEEYLGSQGAVTAMEAQDVYLELAQELADLAFSVLFESALPQGDERALSSWRALGAAGADLAGAVDPGRFELLAAPPIESAQPPGAFASQHFALLQERVHAPIAASSDPEALRSGCRLLMAMALALGQCVGADAAALAARWVATAQGLRAAPSR